MFDDLHERSPLPAHDDDAPAQGHRPTSSPGKSSLTSRLPSGAAGQPLPADVRSMLEQISGAPLNAVRVHTGGQSAAGADEFGARAFAIGQDIHFAAGQYAPESPEGRHLLAHEVAHTIQQADAVAPEAQAKLAISSPGDALESEADRFADAYTDGTASTGLSKLSSAGAYLVSRWPTGVPVVAGSPGGKRNFIFEPEFKITAGTLARGEPRNQRKVFLGDTLTFRARCENFTPDTPKQVHAGVAGRVADVGATPSIRWDGPVLEWTLQVGQMGLAGEVNKPAADVDVHPFVHVLVPVQGDAGKFQHSWRFKVIADLSWMTAQASAASGMGHAAYIELERRLAVAYKPYRAAYLAHHRAIAKRDADLQLKNSVLLSILLAGLGGGLGGAVQQAIRGRGPMRDDLDTVALATGVGDVIKYVGRLGAGVGGRAQGSPSGDDSAEPAAGRGSEKDGAGADPEDWMSSRRAHVLGLAKEMIDACTALTLAMAKAWKSGQTELLDRDPVEIIKPRVEALNRIAVQPRTQEEYASALWQTWIETYSYRVSDLRSPRTRHKHATVSKNFRVSSHEVLQDMRVQCGPFADAIYAIALGKARERAIAEATERNLRDGHTYPVQVMEDPRGSYPAY